MGSVRGEATDSSIRVGFITCWRVGPTSLAISRAGRIDQCPRLEDTAVNFRIVNLGLGVIVPRSPAGTWKMEEGNVNP